MKFLPAVWICCLLLITTAAARAHDPVKLRGWMAYFKTHDGMVEATANHKSGKIYVIGAMGVGFYYPGIGHSSGEKVAKQHAVQYLPATSDAIEGDLHRQYIEIATEYAAKYNRTMLKLMGIPDDQP